MIRHPLTVAVSLASSLLLAGCLGGGGGGSSKPTNDKGMHEPDADTFSTGPAEPRLLDNGLFAARVAIVDTGVDLSALPAERVVGTLNVRTQEADVSGGDTRHGTLVATVVANAPYGNAELDLIQATDTDTAWETALNHGVGQAADRGARAINASFSGRTQLPDPTLSFKGVSSIASLEMIALSNEGRGSVYVVSAGNDGLPLIAGERPVYAREDIYSRMLIVGGSTNEGEALDIDPSSNYPGDDPEWQRRFLTAPFVWPELGGGVAGTSFSSPQVAAYAAAINGQWPHLTAQQVSQLLLDTARRDSSRYKQDNCGFSGNVNCGLYFLGQGEADIDAAMAPSGSLSVPGGDTVEEGGTAPEQSAARLSSAYGDALATSGIFSRVMALDELGRDYAMDLSPRVVTQASRNEIRRTGMARVSVASPEGRQTHRGEVGTFGFSTRQDGHGNTHMARVDSLMPSLQLSAYHTSADEMDPTGSYAESGMMPMMMFQSPNELTSGLDAVTGLKTDYGLAGPLSLVASHWWGDTGDDRETFAKYEAQRTDLGLRLAVNERFSLTPSVGVLSEEQGLLGAQGSGALSLGGQNRTWFAGVRADYRLDDRLTAFAHYDRAQGEAEGSGMIRRIDGLKADAMALGMQWSDSSRQVALAFRQPLRMNAANAIVEVPVGRTLAGDILRETHEVDLSPSGRQQDIELGYAFKTGERSRWQLNLLYSHEPGHERDSAADAAVLLNYETTF